MEDLIIEKESDGYESYNSSDREFEDSESFHESYTYEKVVN